jgi:tRNA threonylcarbamoyladenosine biosynthesis protein TsaB
MKNEVNDTTILSLDTSSRNCSISILCGNKIITEYNFISNNELASLIIPAIEFVMKSAKLDLDDIDVFGVGIGPGVFTGIRIGLSTLKGLIFGKRMPIVPVITLKAIAYKFRKVQSGLISLIPAKRNEVYMAGYISNDGILKEIIAPDLIPIKYLETKLKGLDDFCFIGDGTDIYEKFVKDNFQKCKILRRSLFLATEICQIARQEYMNQNYILDLKKIKPFYLQNPDAETNIEKTQNKNRKSLQ